MDQVYADIPQRDQPHETERAEFEAAEQPPRAQPPRRARRWPWIIGGAVLALLVIAGGVVYWLATRDYQSTTDARIDANVTQMASQVAGRVTDIQFSDNQHVDGGKVLLKIDPRDYQARLDQAVAQQQSAVAQVAQATAQLGVQQASLDQAGANVVMAQADLTQARQDHERFHRVNPHAVTQQQIDQADATFRSQTAKVAAAKQAVDGAKAQVAAAQAQVTAAKAAEQQALAGLSTAKLQLSYTTIVAPRAGRVTYRTVNVGDYVQPGQALFALVQDGPWVEADFKETELAHMRPGQPVRISVDGVPGVTFDGRVDSFQSGTGSQFSALPAENATGNWVKVVQRMPVKIIFDDDSYQKYFLAPGMSVEASVKVR